MSAVRRLVTRAVARAKPAIPESAWPSLLALRSVLGDGPLVARPAAARALVLAAHPDDESLGCAGSLADLTDRGATVEVLFATDGEGTRGSPRPSSEVGAARREEARRAVALLGGNATFAGLPDGGLGGAAAELGRAIADAVGRARPEIVFAPWPGDGHADHRAVAEALAEVRLPAGCEVWGYETWTALPANRLVDITPHIERKQAALASHETAALAFDMSAGLGLSRWRSMHGLMGRGWAEAFLVVAAEDYPPLVARFRGDGRDLGG